MELKENDTIKDILLSAKKEDKTIDILLKSGKIYNGNIKKIGLHCISLDQKGNRSYFDVIIRIDEISAIEVRIRGYNT
ncbi:MAG: hypothetical protein ACFFBW_15670 [Promethearchaeota archaeon]